jgi:hypothetical protein
MKMTKPTKMAIAPTVVPVSISFQISRQGIVGVIVDGFARASDVDTDAVTKMVVVVDGMEQWPRKEVALMSSLFPIPKELPQKMMLLCCPQEPEREDRQLRL